MSDESAPTPDGEWGDTWVPLRFWPATPEPAELDRPTKVPWVGHRTAGTASQPRHRVVLVYDIASDRAGQRRYRQVKRLLESVARRVQRSVFEGDFTPAELRRLVERVRLLLHPDHDDFRCFPRCSRCAGLSVVLFPKARDQPAQRRAWIA